MEEDKWRQHAKKGENKTKKTFTERKKQRKKGKNKRRK